MPKFLIIRFSSIGDIIQCMGIIDGIREHFPDAEIHWIARKDMSSFLAMDKRIGKIWAFDKALGLKGLLKIARQLREEHYDYIYDAHSNIRSNILRLKLLPWWSKGPHFTLRSKERWKRFLLFNWGINRFPWPFRGVVSYRKPLLKWGIDRFPDTYDDWYFPENFPEKLNSRIQAHTITLVPSANWIKKRWPVEHWKKLITLLSEYHFLILAGPGDTFCEEIRKGYDLVILCNPNNPTSSALKMPEIQTILDCCREAGSFLMIDETYVEFAPDINEISSMSLISSFDNLMILRGVSKFYAAPGLRLGYGATSNSQFLQDLLLMQNPWSLNSLGAYAGEKMLQDQEYIRKTRDLILSERDKMCTEISKINVLTVYPAYANFVLVKIEKKGVTSADVFEFLIKQGLMVRDCSSFKELGGEYFRFCIMAPEDNKRLLQGIQDFFA